MTELQAQAIIEILQRMEFLLHASAITLGLMLGLMLCNLILRAMRSSTL